MTTRKQRDLKRRKQYSLNELKRFQLKTLIQNLTLSKKSRYLFSLELNKMNRNSSRIRVKNRCVVTARSHSVLRFCRLSRIKFRELATQGLLMGIRKASW